MNVLNCSSSKARRPLRSGISALSVIWLLACTSAGLWIMLSRKMPTPRVAAAPVAPQSASLVTQNAAIATSRYQPIDQIRVGQRVVTPGTEPGASLPTAVDPATWRLLTLRARNEWPDGTADAIEVQTLQPLAWLAAHHATVGSRVPIPLDLREMGVPPMSADVLAVEPCPPIEAGPGRVVLTTVNHLNNFLFDLKVNGERGPPQNLEVTGWHKLYSEDRGAWASVCELHPGEVLRGRDGPLTIVSLARHPGVERVYNVTVEDEHQYYVSALNVLAHNADCIPNLRDAALDVHNAILDADPSGIAFKKSTVAVHAVETTEGIELRAATSRGRFKPEQLDVLERLGITPIEQPYKQGVHAEDILINALQKDESVQGWGISWGGRQIPLPCDVCGPKVHAAGGWIDFFGAHE